MDMCCNERKSVFTSQRINSKDSMNCLKSIFLISQLPILHTMFRDLWQTITSSRSVSTSTAQIWLPETFGCLQT